MAEYRITFSMDIVGAGETDAAAQADAQLQYIEMVLSVNDSYGGEKEPLDEKGVPTEAAVLFVRQHIPKHLDEVRQGWARRKAQREFEEAQQAKKKMVMQ